MDGPWLVPGEFASVPVVDDSARLDVFANDDSRVTPVDVGSCGVALSLPVGVYL